MYYTVEIIDDHMCVMDEDGNTYAGATLTGYRLAKQQVAVWAETYPIDVATAYRELETYFSDLKQLPMTTYYVGTLARYVLVEAADHRVAEELGRAELQKLYDDPSLVQIRVVRPATDDEIELMRWHAKMTADRS